MCVSIESLLDSAIIAETRREKFLSAVYLQQSAMLEDNKKPLAIGPVSKNNEERMKQIVGKTVTIKKGVQVYSTHPSYDVGGKRSGKTYTVKIHHILPGGVWKDMDTGDIVVKNSRLVWVGAGNYWFEIDVNDMVEKEFKNLVGEDFESVKYDHLKFPVS